MSNLLWFVQSLFWKRDDSIILFGSWFGQRFADNSRFLFQFLSEHKEELKLSKVVWVTRNSVICNDIKDLGYEAYLMDSEESIMYHKTAGIHIICNMSNDISDKSNDILCRYSYGANKINLWHGVMSMKGVANASNEYKKKKEKHKRIYEINEFIYSHSSFYRSFFYGIGGWENCYYLSTTSAGTDILSLFFILPRNHYIEIGNPRVCYSPKVTDKESVIINKLRDFSLVIVYLPTFRNNENVDYFFSFDYEKLLADNNILWIQKTHTASVGHPVNKKSSNNIIQLPSEFDINLIIPYVNVLVTDYSSVAADAMYYYKRLVYYMPDYDEYMKYDRGFIINPKELICGNCFDNPRDLMSYIISLKNVFEYLPDEKYLNLRNKYWGEETSMYQIWHKLVGE